MQDFKEDKDLVKVIGKRKTRNALYRWALAFPILSFYLLAGIIVASQESFSRGLPLVGGFFSSFSVILNNSKNVEYKNHEMLFKLSHDVAKVIGDSFWSVDKLKDIAIIPGNIKVGENLDSINIAPILKKGQYIVMRGNYSLQILVQYEEDDKTVVKLLDRDEIAEVYNALSDGSQTHSDKKMLSFIRKAL